MKPVEILQKFLKSMYNKNCRYQSYLIYTFKNKEEIMFNNRFYNLRHKNDYNEKQDNSLQKYLYICP